MNLLSTSRQIFSPSQFDYSQLALRFTTTTRSRTICRMFTRRRRSAGLKHVSLSGPSSKEVRDRTLRTVARRVPLIVKMLPNIDRLK